jgi:hypothetical protein
MKIFKIFPQFRDLLRSKGIGIGHKVLDDSPDREISMLLIPIPRILAIQLSLHISRGIHEPSSSLGNFGFLLGSEKKIAVRPDGQVLSFFLLQPRVGATLAVEGIKVVNIKLWRRKGPVKGTNSLGVVGLLETKLERGNHLQSVSGSSKLLRFLGTWQYYSPS